MDIQVFIEKFAEAIEVEDTKKLSENTEFQKEVGGKELKACVTLGDLYDLVVK